MKERLQEIRREQGRLDEEKEETKKLAETVKRQIDKLNREKHQFDILCKNMSSTRQSGRVWNA